MIKDEFTSVMSDHIDSYARMLLRRMGLLELRRRTEGHSAFRVALIDGYICKSHPSLANATIHQMTDTEPARTTSAASCHATFIASMLVGRGDGVVSLCPGCTLLSFPVVSDEMINGQMPVTTTVRLLENAVLQAAAEGANIIQISLEFASHLRGDLKPLSEAIKMAAARNISVVMPVGNVGNIGSSCILGSDGVIPVVMCDLNGLPHPNATLDPAACGRGIMALGVGIPGALPPDGYGRRSGSSYAASFVSGTMALHDALHLGTKAISHLPGALVSTVASSRFTSRLVPGLLDITDCL